MARRTPFAEAVPRATKARRGRAPASATPVSIRSRIPLEDDFRTRVGERLGRKLGKFARHIERISVRFDDENGPRGGVDVVCRAKAVLSSLPSQVAEERSDEPRDAFRRASDALARAVQRAIQRAGRTAPRPRTHRTTATRTAAAARAAATTPARPAAKGRAAKPTAARTTARRGTRTRRAT